LSGTPCSAHTPSRRAWRSSAGRTMWPTSTKLETAGSGRHGSTSM
jgi:hypothetical protein